MPLNCGLFSQITSGDRSGSELIASLHKDWKGVLRCWCFLANLWWIATLIHVEYILFYPAVHTSIDVTTRIQWKRGFLGSTGNGVLECKIRKKSYFKLWREWPLPTLYGWSSAFETPPKRWRNGMRSCLMKRIVAFSWLTVMELLGFDSFRSRCSMLSSLQFALSLVSQRNEIVLRYERENCSQEQWKDEWRE